MTTSLSQRRTYRAAGRLDPAPFLLWAVLTVLLTLLLALLMSWLFGHGWYLIILVPALAAMMLAGLVSITIHKGKVRWPAVAAAYGFFIGVLLYGSYLYFCMLAFLGWNNASRFDLLPRYIDHRLHTDVQHSTEMPSEKSSTPDPVMNGIAMTIEVSMVLLLTTAFGYRRAFRTFCEKCNEWKRQNLAVFPPGFGATVRQWIEAGQLENLASVPPYTPTSRGKTSAVVVLERCDWPGGEQCPVYLGVKDVSTTLGGSLVFDESIGKVVVPRIELQPDELAAVLPAFTKTPVASATAPAAGALIQVQDVPANEANKILAKRTVLMANAVALCTLVVFFGSIIGCLGACAFLAHLFQPPINPLLVVATIAAIILCFLLAILSGYIGLKNPGVPGDKFYRFRARRWFSLRRNKLVDPDRPSDLPTFFVGMTPRKNWGKLMLECSTDMGFLQIDPRRRELRFEGDVQRYRIPVSAITHCGLASYSASAGNTRIEYWAVVVQGNTAAGFWEAPFYPRQIKWFPGRDHRLANAQQILDQIAPMLSTDALPSPAGSANTTDFSQSSPPPFPQSQVTSARPSAFRRAIPRLLIVLLAVSFAIWRAIAQHLSSALDHHAQAPDNAPQISLQLTSIKTGQKLLDAPPYFTAGGDWTVFHCSPADDPQAAFAIAVEDPKPPTGQIPVSFSKAELLPGDRQAGARFIDDFSKAFSVQAPGATTPQPLTPAKFETAVLGQNLAGPGQDSSAATGSWTNTKWFIQNEGLDGEIFFNYDLATGQAVFSEKDSDDDDDVLQGFAYALRDGPRPPRTPLNDPNFTTDGPRVTDLQPIPNSAHCVALFARGGKLLLLWRRTAGSPLMAAPLDNPQSVAPLTTFDGIISDVVCADPDANRFVVEERIGQDAAAFTSNDQIKFWWIDRSTNQRRTFTGPWGQFPELASGQHALSPDGRFIIIRSLAGTTLDKKRNSVLDIVNIQTADVVRAQIQKAFLKGWIGDNANLRAVVETQIGSETQPISKLWCITPATGSVAPAEASVSDSFDSTVSPDHLHKFVVHPQSSLDIIDLQTTATTTFNFHPDDRRFANPDAFRWLSPRYIQFDTAKTTFIDITTMKQGNLPTTDRDGQPEPFIFSPDFNWAIVYQKDAVLLVRIFVPPSSPQPLPFSPR